VRLLIVCCMLSRVQWRTGAVDWTAPKTEGNPKGEQSRDSAAWRRIQNRATDKKNTPQRTRER
jgi:hypothetical protein